MSNYTTTIENICKQVYLDNIGNSTNNINGIVNMIIQGNLLFNNLSIEFAESATEIEINKFWRDFLIHFWNREIAYETVNLWKYKLQDKLNTVLP